MPDVVFYRELFGWSSRAFLQEYVKQLTPPRIIASRDGTRPYLERYYLLGGPRTEGDDVDDKVVPQAPYLHHFLRGDEDTWLHNHPWDMSTSFILAGGYREERRVGTAFSKDGGVRVETRTYHPGSINMLGADDFHRVDLLEEDAWTLFVAGKPVQSWGFWDPVTGKYMEWQDFIRMRTPT